MALQGTLETFSVPEVLRLLSGTNKTGHLTLEGDRGAGNVWLADGRIVHADSDHEQGGKVEAVLFDLLRFESGSFVFDTEARLDGPTDHDADVDEVLGEAERLLDEWREIESVVPSLDVHVHMVDELTGQSVTVTADQWRSLALVGSGISARRLGAHLDLGEFDACSLVRDLVEGGLVEVSADALPAPVPDVVVDHDLSNEEVASLGDNLAGFVARPDDTDHLDVVDMDDDVTLEPESELPSDSEPESDFDSDFDSDPDSDFESGFDSESGTESDDFLSQLSNFSPKAAAAIEATADETTTEDVESAAVDPTADAAAEGDEEINRNLLLKFLSSAKN